MWSMLWPILFTVCVSMFYHITMKSTPQDVNAFASLAITYGVGAIASVVLYYLMGSRGLAEELSRTNWTAWLLGVLVVGLEFGNICIYRAGWKISAGSLTVNATLACVLLTVGVLLYHESVSPRQVVGLAVCLLGIWLVNG